MASRIPIYGTMLPWPAVEAALAGPIQVRLAPQALRQLRAGRAAIERHLADTRPIYGINTGFGIFARTRISKKDLFRLQHNVIVSHSSGVGEPLPPAISRCMLLLKLHTLARGHSGVRPLAAEHLCKFLNADCLPVIPAQGSVGASGDLAPLAHLTAPLIGEGEVWWKGQRCPARRALRRLGLTPLTLYPKEGLAFANGTQGMTAVAAAVLVRARETIAHAEIAGALTIEGLFGSIVPFDQRLHAVRPHPGAVASAAIMRKLLARSAIIASHKDCGRVQDPYAMRCIPSVHGVAREAVAHAMATVQREIDSVTDNPLVFPATGDVLSGGNFHGAPVAFAMDALGIALTTLGSITERRIEQLTNPKAGELPVLGLTRHPGLNSGYMMPHVTAASLVAENKTLAHPASIDTIPTWAGQEDHVSMGMWAARKALTIAENAAQIVAIELLAACQAIDLHPTRYTPGRGTRIAYDVIRSSVPRLEEDRFLAPELARMREVLLSGKIRRSVERAIGVIVG